MIREVAASEGQRRGEPFTVFASGRSVPVSIGDGPRGWRATESLPAGVCEQLDLYVPLCTPPSRPFALAHLGQSVDGYIAGGDGQSRSLNGPENIVHLHRLRALFDVVLIGCSTATADDPQLTTRLVEGPHPVRVVFDPSLRCDPALRLFNDATADTVVVCAADAPEPRFDSAVKVLRTRAEQCRIRLADVFELLRAEGLPRIFIEGGGRTVSAALQEGLLDRLHVAVVFIGSGVRGVSLPQLTRFEEALRPPSRRFDMGGDVLFDFELAGPKG